MKKPTVPVLITKYYPILKKLNWVLGDTFKEYFHYLKHDTVNGVKGPECRDYEKELLEWVTKLEEFSKKHPKLKIKGMDWYCDDMEYDSIGLVRSTLKDAEKHFKDGDIMQLIQKTSELRVIYWGK